MHVSGTPAWSTFLIVLISIPVEPDHNLGPQAQIRILYAELGKVAKLNCKLLHGGNGIKYVRWATVNDGEIIFIASISNGLPKNAPAGKFVNRNVTGKFGKSQPPTDHELIIRNPTVADDGEYTCIIHTGVSEEAYGYTDLNLVAPPESIRISNKLTGKVISELCNCCKTKTIKLDAGINRASFACSVSESKPYPKVTWDADFFADVTEESNVTNRSGTQLKWVESVINFDISSKTAQQYNLKCVVRVSDVTTGESKTHDLCISVETTKQVIPSWRLGLITAIILAVVTLLAVLCTRGSTADLGVHHRWVKLSALCSGMSILLAGLCAALSHELLFFAYGFSSPQLSGRNLSLILLPDFLPAVICIICFRVITNAIGLQSYRSWARITDQIYRPVESNAVGRIGFIIGMLAGPGTLYMYMGFGNVLKVDGECQGIRADGGRENPKYSVPHKLLPCYLCIDILGSVIALVNIICFYVTAAILRVSEERYVIECSLGHSIIVYVLLATCFLLNADIFIIMHWLPYRFERDKVLKLPIRQIWRLYVPCPRRNTTTHEQISLDIVADDENPGQGEHPDNLRGEKATGNTEEMAGCRKGK